MVVFDIQATRSPYYIRDSRSTKTKNTVFYSFQQKESFDPIFPNIGHRGGDKGIVQVTLWTQVSA